MSMEQKMMDEWTARHHAAANGHYEVVSMLISNGAKVDSVDNFRETALHSAVDNEHDEMVSILINSRAKVNAENSHGQTALDLTKWKGHANIIAILTTHAAARVDDFGCLS